MKSMNRKEGKKIAVMAAVIMGFMAIAFMPMASAGVTSFTVTPSTGIAGAVDTYTVAVITTGVTSINIAIPAGFLAVAPTADNVELARVSFWNSSTKANSGYATITSNDTTNLSENVDVYCEFGTDTATTTQDVNFTAGETIKIDSNLPGNKSSVIIKLPTETEGGSINITANCTKFLLDVVVIDIKQSVRNPTTGGDYVFSADGVDATVQIVETGTYGGGVFRNGMWVLRTANSPLATVYRFNYGNPTDVPFPGDWNGNGNDGIGVYRDGWWNLRNDKSAGVADYTCNYGNPSDVPVVGNWNGLLEKDGIGVYRNGWWILSNEIDDPTAVERFLYGNPSDVPVVGDWNNDGVDTIGVYRNGQWILSNVFNVSGAIIRFNYGNPSDVPVVGDWNNDGTDGIGVYRNGWWILRDGIGTAAVVDYRFRYGNPTDVPVPGSWVVNI